MGIEKLNEILDAVRDEFRAATDQRNEFNASLGSPHRENYEFADREVEAARPFLPLLLQDHSDKGADELEDMARKLSPGFAHNSGLLACAIYENYAFVDHLLLAAMFRFNWHGGKTGFQFLPLPHQGCDHDDYELDANGLVSFLGEATDWNARRVLTDDDLAFYENLPDRIRVYRGCAGIDAGLAAKGVCWTTDRKTAEWFAWRGAHYGEPVLVSAVVHKDDVPIVKHSEWEVVTQPCKWRQLKCRKQIKRP